MQELIDYLRTVPGILEDIETGDDEGYWWVKFRIDVDHPFAWNVIQNFGYVLNNLAVNRPLPTRFIPVSPPPYSNGGPDQFLSWVIRAENTEITSEEVRNWLEGKIK